MLKVYEIIVVNDVIFQTAFDFDDVTVLDGRWHSSTPANARGRTCECEVAAITVRVFRLLHQHRCFDES